MNKFNKMCLLQRVRKVSFSHTSILILQKTNKKLSTQAEFKIAPSML